MRRDEILRAARRRFARHGYAGTSMRQIAQAARVTKASLYYHFPDKAALFREATQNSLKRLHDLVRERTRGISDPGDRLRAAVRAYLEAFVEERDLIHRLSAVLLVAEEERDWVADVIRRYELPIRSALVAYAAAGHLEKSRVADLTALILGGIEHAVIHWQFSRRAAKPGSALADRLLARVLPVRARHPRSTAAVWLLPLLFLVAPAMGVTGSPDAVPVAGNVVVGIPGSAMPLAVEDCVQEALTSNAGLQAERMRREELRGQMTQAISIGLPTLDLTGTWTRGRDPSFALDESFQSMDLGDEGDSTGGGGSFLDSLLAGTSFFPAPEDVPTQTFWRTSFNAHWELNLGLIYNAIGAAGVGIERQELMVADAEHRTAEATMAGYYAVIMTGENLAALDADVATRREFLDVTRRRFFLGLSTGLDTLRAAVACANLIPLRRRAAQRLRDAASRLNVLMGRRPLAPLSVHSTIPVEDDRIDSDLAAARVPQRPDIRQVEFYCTMLRKNRGALKAQHRPSLSADGSYGYVTRELPDLLDKGHDFWNASVSLRIPLFDGMLTKGKVQEAEATLRRVRRELDEAVRQARLEVLSLHGDLAAAHANHNAAALNLVAAEDALRQITLRYELGKADYLSILDAQTQRFVARRNLISARNEVLSLTASFKRALGFSPNVPLAEVVRTLSGDSGSSDPSGR